MEDENSLSALIRGLRDDESLSFSEKVAIVYHLIMEFELPLLEEEANIEIMKDIEKALEYFYGERLSTYVDNVELENEIAPYIIINMFLVRSYILLTNYQEALSSFQKVALYSAENRLETQWYLPPLLALTKQHEAAKRNLEENCEVSTFSLYTRALVAAIANFPDFNQNAIAAFRSNSHVVSYLTGKKRMPKKPVFPEDYDEGSLKEAQMYVSMMGDLWKSVPGVIDRLAEALKDQKPAKRRRRQSLTLISKDELVEFYDEIIQADLGNRRAVCKVLYTWAERLFAKEPWLTYVERPVCITLAETCDNMVAHFSGGLGEVFGCNVYDSESRYWNLIEELDMYPYDYDTSTPDEMVRSSVSHWDMASLNLTVEPFMTVDVKDRTESLMALGLKKADRIPVLGTKHSGFLPSSGSLVDMVDCLIGLLGLAHMMAVPFDPNNDVIDVDISQQTFLAEKLLKSSSLSKMKRDNLLTPAETSAIRKVKESFAKLEPSEADWEVGFVSPRVAIKGQAGRDQMVLTAMVVDKHTETVIGFEQCIGADSPLRAMAKALRLALTSTRQKPSSITFASSCISSKVCEQLEVLDLSIEEHDSPEAFVKAAHAMIEAQLGDPNLH